MFKLSCMVVFGFAPTGTDCHCVCKWCAFELELYSSWAKSAMLSFPSFLTGSVNQWIFILNPFYLCEYLILIMPLFPLSMELFSWILESADQALQHLLSMWSVDVRYLQCAFMCRPAPPPPTFCSGLKNSFFFNKTFFGYRNAFSVAVCVWVRDGWLVLSKQALAEMIKRCDSQDHIWNI